MNYILLYEAPDDDINPEKQTDLINSANKELAGNNNPQTPEQPATQNENPNQDTGENTDTNQETPQEDNPDQNIDDEQDNPDATPDENTEDPETNKEKYYKYYKLEKLYARLCSIKDILDDVVSVQFDGIKDEINEAIELFDDILVPNLDLYETDIDDIVEKYYKFINSVTKDINSKLKSINSDSEDN